MIPPRPDDTGKQKVWNYLQGLSEEPDFQKKSRVLREKYDLPPEGLKDLLYSQWENSEIYFVRWPDHLRDSSAFRDEMLQFTNDLGLDFMWTEVLEHYVIYNKWDWNMGSMANTFEIHDAHNDLLEGFENKEDEQDFRNYLKHRATSYPVTISVHPYASQRDIIEYIKKNYKWHILPLLKRYRKEGVKIGVIRKRKPTIRERNAFIYKHRDLPKKKLMSLVADNFHEVMDYTYLSKIIAKEEKKNK